MMQNGLFLCCVCQHNYDNCQHLPRFLPCGHTFCSNCLLNLTNDEYRFICPLDNKSYLLEGKKIEVFPVNVMLMQALGNSLLVQQEDFCHHHQESKKSICLTDREKVCIYCLQLGHHRDHTVKHTKDVIAEGENKSYELKLLIQEFEEHNEATANLLQEQRNNLLMGAKSCFETLKSLLEMKEQETISEINFLFDLEEGKAHRILQDDLKLKDSVKTMACNLVSGQPDNKFFDAFEAKMPTFNTTRSFDSVKRRLGDIRREAYKCVEPFINSISIEVQQYQFAACLKELLDKNDYSYFSDKDESNVFRIRSLVKFEAVGDSLIITDKKSGTPDDATAIDMVPNLENWDNIEQVILDLNRFSLSNDALAALECAWKYLGHVKSLRVNFADPKMNDLDVSKLCLHDVWASSNLKELELNLQRCQASDQSMVKLISGSLQKMEGLTDFNLNLSGTKITNRTVEALGKYVMQSLGNVEKLQLNLGDTKVGDQGVERLFHKMEKLRFFVLKLGNTEVTDKSLQAFSHLMLPSLKDIEAIQLDLSNTEITDAGASNISFDYENVKTFSLNLSGTFVTDKGIREFGEHTLMSMKKLESLYLGLNDTTVTDESITSLVDKKVAIKYLTLGLSNTNITKVTLEKLTQAIVGSEAKALLKLHLDLERTKSSDLEICQTLKVLVDVVRFTCALNTVQVNDRNIQELMSGALLVKGKKGDLPQKKGLLKKLFSK